MRQNSIRLLQETQLIAYLQVPQKEAKIEKIREEMSTTLVTRSSSFKNLLPKLLRKSRAPIKKAYKAASLNFVKI